MKGGTRKRGKTWSYYFDMGSVNGKRQKKEKGGFATKKEAESALASAIDEYNNAGMVLRHLILPCQIILTSGLTSMSKCTANIIPRLITSRS